MIRPQEYWFLLMEKNDFKFIYFGQKGSLNDYNMWVILTYTYWVVGEIKQVDI